MKYKLDLPGDKIEGAEYLKEEGMAYGYIEINTIRDFRILQNMCKAPLLVNFNACEITVVNDYLN